MPRAYRSGRTGAPSTEVVTTLDDLEDWSEALVAFHARLADRFARRESREQVAEYLQGLLAPVEGKGSWQVAEAVGDTT